jgi:hypothetical protein
MGVPRIFQPARLGYEVEIEEVKRELAYWQNYTIDLEQSLVELGQCIQAVNQITNFWDTSTIEERHKMVSAIFQSVFYDLNQQRIPISSYSLGPNDLLSYAIAC